MTECNGVCDKRASKHNRKRQITRTIVVKRKDAEGEI